MTFGSASKPALRRIGCRNKASLDGDRRFLLLPQPHPRPLGFAALDKLNASNLLRYHAPGIGRRIDGPKAGTTVLLPRSPPQARHVGDGRGREGENAPLNLCEYAVSTLRPAYPKQPTERRRRGPKPDRWRALELLASSPDGCSERSCLRVASAVFFVCRTLIPGSMDQNSCAMWRGI